MAGRDEMERDLNPCGCNYMGCPHELEDLAVRVYENEPRIEPRINENELADGHAYHAEKIQATVNWSTKGLHDVRLRLLSDPGFPYWDVSYCVGYLGKGFDYKVRVILPFGQIPKGTDKNRVSTKMWLVEEARKHGVYAKGIGLLDGLSRVQV